MEKMVFNPYNKVRIKKNGKPKEISVREFLATMHKNYKSDSYNVFLNFNNTTFIITYDGIDYEAFLPNDVLECIRTGNYKKKPLAEDLMELAGIEKKYNDYLAAKIEYEERIREIEVSGYSELIDMLDYEMYLKYLSDKLKIARSDNERYLINAKIKGVLKVLTNPHNLKSHIYQFISKVASKGQKLDETKREELKSMLHSITDDYYKGLISKGNQSLVLGSSDKPMKIIRRIVDVENLVISWLKEAEECKKDIPQLVVDNQDFEEMSQQLHEFMRDKGGKR